MCAKYVVFRALKALGGLSFDKALYCDTDTLFVKDVNQIFEGVQNDVLYLKPEPKFPPGVDCMYFNLPGDIVISDVPYFNAGHFVFSMTPSIDTIFEGFLSEMPELCSRSRFVDQAPFNSYVRRRVHLESSFVVDFDRLKERIRFDNEAVSDKNVLVHYIDGNKVPRMAADLQSE